MTKDSNKKTNEDKKLDITSSKKVIPNEILELNFKEAAALLDFTNNEKELIADTYGTIEVHDSITNISSTMPLKGFFESTIFYQYYSDSECLFDSPFDIKLSGKNLSSKKKQINRIFVTTTGRTWIWYNERPKEVEINYSLKIKLI